jgi:putative ABC transport system permease protein
VKTLRVSLFLAGRSMIRSNYGVAVTTVLMMLLIYVSLLFLPSLIQGAVNRINSQLVDTLTSDIVITPATRAASIDDAGAYLAKIRQTEGVAQATAVYRVGTQVTYGDNSGSWAVDAIDPATYGQVFTTPSNMFEGRALTSNDTSQVLLGIGIAGAGQTSLRGYKASLESVHAGDKVTITLTTGQTSTFTVAGIYDNQFPLSDDDAYITMAEAQKLVPGSSDRATTIYVKTDSGANVNQVAQRLSPLRSGMKFETSEDLGATVEDQVATFNLISDILKIISLAMAAVTIFIITYIDLVNKRRQIGIERAIGIRSAPIVLSYVTKAGAYALAGIGAGFLLFKYAVTPAVSQHPFHFPNGPVTLATTWGETVRDLTILIIVAILAALIPSIRSVGIKILDAIWGN